MMISKDELLSGLSAKPASISSKYLYDTLGSKLFEAICALPEYYPTRTEAAIFDAHLPAIAKSIGTGTTLIDLGAGNCEKAAKLFPVLQPAQYVPIDISADFLRDAVCLLQQRFPRIDINAVGSDFSRALELPETVRREQRLFFYPGSSIGNFSKEEASIFLRRLHKACEVDEVGGRAQGGVLIGVDLVKDNAILNAAYDDALGVTAAFNLNVLRHANRLLGTDFDVRDWRHRAFFNASHSRIEMHLEAQRNVTVTWQGEQQNGQRDFAEGESIHTENSYKYTKEAFLDIVECAGFGRIKTWHDERDWFMVCHAHA